MSTRIRKLAAVAAFSASAVLATAAHAGTFTFELTRATLGNVNDAQGVTQYEGGTVADSTGANVGYYNTVRRVVTGGSDQLNAGATTVTLFFPKSGTAANTLTLQGAHDFSSGVFAGSVSATASVFGYLRDADASYTIPGVGHTTLVISWTGATPAKLP